MDCGRFAVPRERLDCSALLPDSQGRFGYFYAHFLRRSRQRNTESRNTAFVFSKFCFCCYLKNDFGNFYFGIKICRNSVDFEIAIGYLPRYKSNPTKVSPENNIDCPFGELGLVDILNRRKKTYKKSVPASDMLNPYVILAVIVKNADGRREISLNELLTAPKNIGKVYNLDSITMLDVLYRIEKLGLIKINRTAGLDVITIQEELDFYDCVERFYASIDEQGQENER